MGVGHTTVQRVWKEHGLKPHLTRTFKLSNDPQFAEKMVDVVGLYLDPPNNAAVPVGRREEPNPGARAGGAASPRPHEDDFWGHVLSLHDRAVFGAPTSTLASDGPSEHASKIVVDGVQVLGGYVHGPYLDHEPIADHAVAECCFRCIRPIPCEVHGFAVTRRDARLLGRRERRRQMLDRIGFYELPEELALRRPQVGRGETHFLRIRSLLPRVGKNVP